MGLTSAFVVAVIIVSVVQSGKLGLEIDILEVIKLEFFLRLKIKRND